MSTNDPPASDDRDRRLGEAIDAYVERIERGESITPDAWVRRHPQIADELQRCLAALPLLRQALEEPPESERQRSSDRGTASRSLFDPGAEFPTVPGYRIEQEIGRGGMAVVYRAVQETTKRVVALKLLASGAYASQAARRRFEREIELVAGLEHPGIVQVYDAGEHNGQLYCAMALVEGETLYVHARRRELTVEKKLRLFASIVEAVQFAHQHGVIHRDLKPSNIMIDRAGRPRILDFGLARVAVGQPGPDESRLTREGHLVGTLPYLSPEQASGAAAVLDTRSDTYALGVILYELLTGRMPYDTSGTLVEALHNICHTVPLRPSRLCRSLNADIDAVVLRALEKSKEDRYAGVAELLDDLRCCLRGEPVSASRTSRFYLLRKVYARHRTQMRLVLAGIAVLLATSVVITAMYLRVRREHAELQAQYHVTRVRRGLSQLAAGHDMLAERTLLAAYRDRADATARWSLLAYFIENPLLASVGEVGWVTDIAFSNDGRYLASSNLDGVVQIYDAASFELLKRFEAHPPGPTRVAFAAGDALVTAGSDGQIKYWGTENRILIGSTQARPVGITQFRLARASVMYLALGADHKAVCWHMRGGVAEWLPIEQDQPVLAADLARSGDAAAFALQDGSIRIVEPATGRVLSELNELPAAVEALRFGPAGRQLVVSSASGVSLWDWASGALRWSATAGLSEPRPSSLWDRAPKPHVTWTPSLVFSEDGSVVFVAGWDAVVRAWDTETGARFAELRAHGTAVYTLAVQPGTRRLAAGTVGELRVWDIDRHPATMCRELPPDSTSTALSAARGLVAIGGDDGAVTVSSIRRSRADLTWQAHDASVAALAFDADAEHLATADALGAIVVWRIADRSRVASVLIGPHAVRVLTFTPDGTTLVVGDVDGTIHLLDLLGDVPLRSWSAHDGPVLALAFAPDGRRFVSGGADWRVRLWRLGETEPLGEWQHDEWVNALAFSTDGSRIASGGAFLNIHLGRPEAQPDRLIPSAHAHWINGLAFVKRGRVLISGGNDAAVRFWDADSGQELATLTSHGGPVHTIDVSDDGRYLAVGAVNAVQLIDLEASASLIPTAEAVGAERD